MEHDSAFKKEGNFVTCYEQSHMNQQVRSHGWILRRLDYWNKPVTKRPMTVWSHWYEVSVIKLIKTGNRMVVARGWEEGEMGLMFNGYRVSVLQHEKLLDSCCTTMWIGSTVLSCTLKKWVSGKFYVEFFTTIKNFLHNYNS